MEIYNASLYDLNAIYAIEKESFEEPYPPSLLKSFMILFNDMFLIAKSSDDIVGYIIGGIRNGVMGHVISIAVKENFRGRGVAERLLVELERLFYDKKAKFSYLEVNVKNTRAISFYRKMGYRISGFRVDYYNKGVHAFIMQKPLVEVGSACE